MLDKLNFYGKRKTPFLFIIDYEKTNPIVIPLSKINNNEILYQINDINNFSQQISNIDIIINKKPVTFNEYVKSYKKVYNNLEKGNSYLVNLTFKTEIDINCSLKEFFFNAHAKYKLFYKDNFIVFSPEIFVNIKNGFISTFPMKGTIDSSIENAEEMIINDEKEFAEHITVVDLLRNDLNMVSTDVETLKFRYIDKIRTNNKDLLQISSEIRGKLNNNYFEFLGDIFDKLLPAGSVTGAPKKKTIEIIKEAENYKRGFYTGVFGIFDGVDLQSAVMIRFIEKEGDKYYYKSGGGITIYSDPLKEYNEMKDKIYVPLG